MVSILVYAVCDRVLGMDPLLANIISWILAVGFAYVTNRRWVFESKASGSRAVLQEAAAFYGGRLITLGLEELLLYIGIKQLGFDSLLVKIVCQIIVIVANYVISKLIVFRDRKRDT